MSNPSQHYELTTFQQSVVKAGWLVRLNFNVHTKNQLLLADAEGE